MNNIRLGGTDTFLFFVGICHAVLGLYSLIEFFVGWGNGCWQGAMFLFIATSISVLCNILLIFKIKKANLYQPETRKKYKFALVAVALPVLVNMLFSVVWWGQSDLNPTYCVFVTQMGLSERLGIVYEIYGLLLGGILVAAIHAYTKRKFFLIAIGGPQNQVIRDDNVNQLANNPMNLVIIINNNPDYQQFQDNVQPPDLQKFVSEHYIQRQGENRECYICLYNFIDEPERKVIRTECGHLFHNNCLKDWISSHRQECPTCRRLLF